MPVGQAGGRRRATAQRRPTGAARLAGFSAYRSTPPRSPVRWSTVPASPSKKPAKTASTPTGANRSSTITTPTDHDDPSERVAARSCPSGTRFRSGKRSEWPTDHWPSPPGFRVNERDRAATRWLPECRVLARCAPWSLGVHQSCIFLLIQAARKRRAARPASPVTCRVA